MYFDVDPMDVAPTAFLCLPLGRKPSLLLSSKHIYAGLVSVVMRDENLEAITSVGQRYCRRNGKYPDKIFEVSSVRVRRITD